MPPPASTTLQVTAVFDVPVTVAVNCCESPVFRDSADGLTATVAGAAVTVTVAWLHFVESAMLVACTWYVPGVMGAVYRPLELTTPPPDSTTAQFTDVFEAPLTVAVNACVWPTPRLTEG